MRVVDLIMKKRRNEIWTDKEIKFLIEGYTSGEIEDYQMSAIAMVIIFMKMNTEEIASFTKYMIHSGETIDLTEIKGIKTDKHSTGGIGDNTTIAVAPIVASLGAIVAKMSGKGLGYTGGTLDKLESIPGYKVEINKKRFIEQVKNINIAVIGQTKDIVPADKSLYALRDVTGTVDSIGLITSSIMCKKLATGSDTILLDIKCGNGAFMKTIDSAKELANSMINVGKKLNKNVRALITDMSKPLGQSIGNKNEILEAVYLLQGKKVSSDFKEIVYEISANILLQSKITSSINEGYKMIDKTINNGNAISKFKEWIKAQNGDVDSIFKKNFWNPKYKYDVISDGNGFMNIKSAIDFGNIAMQLGAGRTKKTDNIDNEAGIWIHKKTNDKVKKGEILFTLYSSTKINPQMLKKYNNAYEITTNKVKTKIIIETIYENHTI